MSRRVHALPLVSAIIWVTKYRSEGGDACALLEEGVRDEDGLGTGYGTW